VHQTSKRLRAVKLTKFCSFLWKNYPCKPPLQWAVQQLSLLPAGTWRPGIERRWASGESNVEISSDATIKNRHCCLHDCENFRLPTLLESIFKFVKRLLTPLALALDPQRGFAIDILQFWYQKLQYALGDLHARQLTWALSMSIILKTPVTYSKLYDRDR
jgi:hypothetical protein